MIDHISLRVQDYSRAVAFYRAALAPIGYDVIMEFPNVAGLGAGGMPDLWLMATGEPVNPTHLAFTADRGRVDAFHSAAMAAGGSDNGPPGVRANYHPHYYAAYVRDPEGNNIEVVSHVDPDAPAAPPPSAAKTSSARRPAKAAGKKPAKKAAKKVAKAARAKAAPRKAAGKGSGKASAGRRPAKKKRR